MPLGTIQNHYWGGAEAKIEARVETFREGHSDFANALEGGGVPRFANLLREAPRLGKILIIIKTLIAQVRP